MSVFAASDETAMRAVRSIGSTGSASYDLEDFSATSPMGVMPRPTFRMVQVGHPAIFPR